MSEDAEASAFSTPYSAYASHNPTREALTHWPFLN